jgi:integrase
LGKQISRLVRERIGIESNPHLMRHLAAKISHKARPGDYETTRRLLGHVSSDTTFNTYEGLETSAATEAYDRLIGQLAGQAAQVGASPTFPTCRRPALRAGAAW